MEEKNLNSPTPITQPKVVPQKPKKKTWLIVLVIVLAVLFLSVSGYIVYQEFIKDDEVVDDGVEISQDEEELSDPDLIEEDVEVCEIGEEECEEEIGVHEEFTRFEGEVLSAELPEGWSMIEYFDGAGTDALPVEMGDYFGLTAVDIVNPESLQVFTIQAVSGIGFVGCPNYVLFEDDNPAYQNEQKTISDEMGEPLNITNYTDEEYSEFEFLGVTFRRVGEEYYYDTQEGNNYFEPPCVEGLLTLEGLYFTDEDGMKYEAYFYGGTEDATLEDLKVVDEILESVKLI